MIDIEPSTRERAACAPPARRGASASALRCAGSTGCCSAPSRRCSPTASGRSTGSRATTGSQTSPADTYAAGGFVVFLGALLVDPDVYRRYKQLLYGGTLGADGFVLVGGTVVRGSRRWIDLGFFQLQPSEFGKVLFILFLAGFLADRGRRVGEAPTVAGDVGLAARADRCSSIVQPDLGTALVYGAALAAVLFVAGRALAAPGDPRRASRCSATFVLWARPRPASTSSSRTSATG